MRVADCLSFNTHRRNTWASSQLQIKKYLSQECQLRYKTFQQRHQPGPVIDVQANFFDLPQFLNCQSTLQNTAPLQTGEYLHQKVWGQECCIVELCTQELSFHFPVRCWTWWQALFLHTVSVEFNLKWWKQITVVKKNYKHLVPPNMQPHILFPTMGWRTRYSQVMHLRKSMHSKSLADVL